MLQGFAKGAQPWHMEVHYIEPHDAYVPLKKYLDRYDPRSIPVPKLSGPLRRQARSAQARIGELGPGHRRRLPAGPRALLRSH